MGRPMKTKIFRRTVLRLTVGTLVVASVASAQQRGSDPEHTLDLTWDRWLDHDELG